LLVVTKFALQVFNVFSIWIFGLMFDGVEL